MVYVVHRIETLNSSSYDVRYFVMILFVLVCFDTHTAMEGFNRATYEVPSDLAEIWSNIQEYQPTYLRTCEQ